MALRQKRQPLELWLVDALPAENVLLLVTGKVTAKSDSLGRS
jgi:hypothetical protein